MPDGLAAVALLLFVVVVAPIWIIAHYATKWRAARTLGPEEEERLASLLDAAERLERRIANIERILDIDSPEWRESQERGREP
jgi:phage shock protein B